MKFTEEKECFKIAEQFVKSIPDSLDLLQAIQDYVDGEELSLSNEMIMKVHSLVSTVFNYDFPKELKPAEWYCARCGVKRVKYGLNCKECSELVNKKREVTPDVGIAAIANKDTENVE